MAGRVDHTGRRFGRLTVAGLAGRASDGRSLWNCRCDCGGEAIVRGNNLTTGNTTSCGCVHLESIRKHGRYLTPEYRSWQGMLRRCYRPRTDGYAMWGGRGIRVCDRWRHSFENFLSDMGPRPSPKHSVDRIDNDGNYCPENCRWATHTEQGNNTRRNRMVELDGARRSLTEWARAIDASPACIAARIERGWPVRRALTEPPNRNIHEGRLRAAAKR